MAHRPFEHTTPHGSGSGVATLSELVGRSEPRPGRPSAATVVEEDGVKVVAFEFHEGDELHEHAAPHPALIQVVRGSVDFQLPEGPVQLRPGQVLHLTEGLLHAVRALEPTTLSVTLLLH